MQLYRPNERPINNPRISKKKRWILGIILAVILVILGLIHFASSPFFKIKKIEVSEISNFSSPELILNLKSFFANKSKIASFFGGDNILVWTGNVEDFLRTEPSFESLEIKKNYFTKEVIVKATEREKFGIWCQISRINSDQTQINSEVRENQSQNPSLSVKGDSIRENQSQNPNKSEFCGWFDKNGVIFKETAVIESEIFKRVNDFSSRNLKLGENILPQRLFANLIKIFGVLERVNLNAKTLCLKDLAFEEVYIESVSDPKIFFSLRNDPEFSLSAIGAFKKSNRWEKISYIDFRVENKVYYKFK